MTPWLLEKVRNQLMNESSPAKEVALHDWLVYAVCRGNGRKWVIDSNPSLKYRQHENNVIGANAGWKAKWSRFKRLKQGWYRAEVIKITQICNSISPSIETEKLGSLLVTKNLFTQFKLLAYVTKARRSLLDRCLLALSIAVGIF
jgi:rhamnosyltransferase